MSKHITLIVKLPIVPGVAIADYKKFITDAIEGHEQHEQHEQIDSPIGRLAYTLPGKVKVVSPRKAVVTKGKK